MKEINKWLDRAVNKGKELFQKLKSSKYKYWLIPIPLILPLYLVFLIGVILLAFFIYQNFNQPQKGAK